MQKSLNGSKWQMRGAWPCTPLFGRSMETGAAMGWVTGWMDATVPGCVHADLLACGAIEDPYWGMNSLKCEWVEHRWWVYRTEFSLEEACGGQSVDLVFEGIDNKCHIFLNNEKVGEHEGMFEPVRLDVSGCVRFGAPNILEVALESPPDEMGQIGYTSKVRTQKSRFGYKWDFSTRLVHSGIWDDVYLEITPGARIESLSVRTGLEGGVGFVAVSAAVAAQGGGALRLEASLVMKGTAVDSRACVLQAGAPGDISLEVPDPLLWWPNGYGAQPLYDLEVRLFRGDGLCDVRACKVGVRSLEYCMNDEAEGALPYTVKINGERIYVRGVNMTPLDHMIGAVAGERYERMLALARDAHVNLVRVWGGGIIEKRAFYGLCDKYGILVWQEFNQSSSGIDNIPPTDGSYLQLLRKNATAAILDRRNHVSLAFWSGGNELMDASGVPVTHADENIAMLGELLRSLDPGRLFLPTSASGPNEFLVASDIGRARHHDVHGPWLYQGPEGQYTLFNTSDSLLHSEFGVEGFTNYETALKFLPEEDRKPSTIEENAVWKHHGEWWDPTARDRSLFGEAGNLRRMAACSQFIQAEGLRYAVEANRRRAFRNSGSIVWQFNEPWPNLFCTNLVDYTLRPKMAYWWVRRAYAPVAASLCYDRLVWKEGDRFTGALWLADNTRAYTGSVAWRVMDLLGQVRHKGAFTVESAGRHSAQAGEVSFAIEGFPHGFFIVEVEAQTSGSLGVNQYLFSCNPEPAFSALLTERLKADVRLTPADGEGAMLVENMGDTAALFVRLYGGEGQAAVEDGGIILFPGKSRTVRLGAASGDIRADWLNREAAEI